MSSYVTSTPWSSERPVTLMICCSDGRYRPHLEEFVNQRVAERPDIIALPGGPATVDAWSSSFDHARVLGESLELLLSSHPVREVWLVAHEGCSYYKQKHPSLDDAARRERQLADLKHSRQLVLERKPALAVHLVYARVDNGHVQFEDVAPA